VDAVDPCFHLAAVESHIRASDVPVGLFLSGGLDSGAICAASVELGHKNFHTFSIGGEGNGKDDELPLARLVSRRFGTRHHEIAATRQQYLDQLDTVAWHFDEPYGDETGAALLLLDQIGKLKDGKVTISDTKVSLSGMARDLGGREAIVAALKNLPEGFSVAANEVKAPPYIFQAYKDPVAVTLTLTGYVPDNNVHAAIAAAAGRKFFSEKVVDNLKASVGAPGGFASAVVPALGALSRLSTGTLEVSDREAKLSGDALYDAAAAQIRSGLGKDFPQGWQFKADISVKPATAPVDATVCQQLFSDLLAKGKIRFESGRATIDPDSTGLLDRLVETALRCPTANIEIAGHTDADGEDGFNRTLSERRAQAVSDYLVKAGLPANRFTAVGYGSSQPVASNDTDEGKAQNRRIDFVVR
jgi:OOP family OmpA-OmpF porin